MILYGNITEHGKFINTMFLNELLGQDSTVSLSIRILLYLGPNGSTFQIDHSAAHRGLFII